jgi:hypothetical protein
VEFVHRRAGVGPSYPCPVRNRRKIGGARHEAAVGASRHHRCGMFIASDVAGLNARRGGTVLPPAQRATARTLSVYDMDGFGCVALSALQQMHRFARCLPGCAGGRTVLPPTRRGISEEIAGTGHVVAPCALRHQRCSKCTYGFGRVALSALQQMHRFARCLPGCARGRTVLPPTRCGDSGELPVRDTGLLLARCAISAAANAPFAGVLA